MHEPKLLRADSDDHSVGEQSLHRDAQSTHPCKFGDDFWGFWMLGGMSGGGMGFIFNPARKAEALESLGVIMQTTKDELKSALPFAMDPVVYDFASIQMARLLN